MSQLGDLLELMHNASSSRRSVAGTLREWRDERLVRRMEERGDATWFTDDVENRRTWPGQVEIVTQFWVERPNRLRLERRDEDGELALLVVLDGMRRATYTAGWGGEIEDQQAGDVDWALGVAGQLLAPGFLLGELEIHTPGFAKAAGRAVVVARSRERSQLAWPFGTTGEQELLVDAESGALLRFAGLIDDQEALVYELQDLTFEPDLNDELFTFDPPGANLSGLGLLEVARLASFSVWALPLPVGDIQYRAPARAGEGPESVTLTYSEVTLLETAADQPFGFSSYEEPARVERDGRSYWSLPGVLMVGLDDTSVLMTADSEVPQTQLLDWAATLTKLD